MGSSRAPIHLGGSSLGKNRHVCAFFHSEEEELEVLTAFLTEGLKNDERAVHIHASPSQLHGIKALESAGVDVAQAFDTGQLEYASPGRAYLNDGEFDQTRVLELIKAGQAMGSPRTRLVGHVNALFRQFVGPETWIAYEARLNELLIGFDDPVICAYDLSTLSGEMMLAILSTHPVVFADGRLRPNPFFVTPLVVIAEIEERRRRIPPAGHSQTRK